MSSNFIGISLMSNLIITKKLDSGSFGTVYHAQKSN